MFFRKSLLPAALVIVACATVPEVAHAKTVTSTMTAKVKVDTACRVVLPTVNFGFVPLISGQVDTTADINLICGPSVAYTVSIDNGLYYNGQRRMYGGTRFGFQLYVPYELYRDSARTLVWGTGANQLSGVTPANGKATLTVYGRVPNSLAIQNPYADAVTVTVNF